MWPDFFLVAYLMLFVEPDKGVDPDVAQHYFKQLASGLVRPHLFALLPTTLTFVFRV